MRLNAYFTVNPFHFHFHVHFHFIQFAMATNLNFHSKFIPDPQLNSAAGAGLANGDAVHTYRYISENHPPSCDDAL